MESTLLVRQLGVMIEIISTEKKTMKHWIISFTKGEKLCNRVFKVLADHNDLLTSIVLKVHPSSTNSTSYESRHLQLKFETSVRSLDLIVWPQEGSEVTEVKMKKILDENPKITNFCVTEVLYTSKESL